MVVISEFATLGHTAFVVLLRQLQSTINKVAIDSYEFVIATRLEVGPRKVIVLRLGCVSC